MSNEEIFEQFLRDSGEQFKNIQRAVEIMTAYTANGFDESPRDATLASAVFRMIVDDISTASNSPTEMVENLGREFGAIVNGFSSLTGAIICQYADATGQEPSEILSSFGNLAAQIQAEIEIRNGGSGDDSSEPYN